MTVRLASVTLALACLAVVGCGGAKTDTGLYAARWEAPSRDLLPGDPPRLVRSSRSVVIEVEDGVCVGARDAPPPRRVHHIAVRETPSAVYIAVFMRPRRRPPGGWCAGVGEDFLRRVTLRAPVGRRAIVNAGLPDHDANPIVYPSLDPQVQHALERSYGARWAHNTCRANPHELAGQYAAQGPSAEAIANSVADNVAPAARASAHRACLDELAHRR